MLVVALLGIALVVAAAAWQTVDLYGPALGMRSRRGAQRPDGASSD